MQFRRNSRLTPSLPALFLFFISVLTTVGSPITTARAATSSGYNVASAVATKAARARSTRSLRRLGVLAPGTPLTRSIVRRPAVPRSTVAPRAIRRGLPLQFKFENFEPAQVTDFQTFLKDAYPLMVALYGEPVASQQGKTLRVKAEATAGDGIYELPLASEPASAGTVLYQPVFPGGTVTEEQARNINNYNLARQILIAFHGRSIFSFDAWELGFSDAAALVVMYQYLKMPATFDASALGVYLLPVYDYFNRPELGNAFFFTSNETSVSSPVLGFFRAGMAQAAWLKVWVENPAFFKSFNEEYYRQDAASAAPLSAPQLKQIALKFVPTVEGLKFTDWYRRQYVLDTSVTVGEKLWVAVLPLTTIPADNGSSLFFGLAQYYRTLANGDEQAVNGNGTLLAFDETGLDITDRSPNLNDNSIAFIEGEAEVTVGFKNLGSPDQARITLAFRAGNAESIGYFPYNVAGTDIAPSGFYGATLGTNRGQVGVQVDGSPNAVSTLARGAFKSSRAYPSGPRVRTTFTVAPSDGAAVRVLRRNSAWSYFGGRTQSLAVLLETAPGNTPVAANWSVASNSAGANRLRMISLPVFPEESDEAEVLGIDPLRLLLARYRPDLSPASFFAAGVQFGISNDRHELYPNISHPIAPGRGYWLKLPATAATTYATTVTGGEPPRTRPYEVPLLGGWNQIGVPFRSSFNVARLRVSLNNSTPAAYSLAISRGWISPGIWRWKPEGGYARVDAGATSAQELQPFEGYYIFTSQPKGIKLIFDPTLATASPALTAPINGEWEVGLTATTATARDTNNAFGVTTLVAGKPRRVAAAKPPTGESALTLAFLSSGTAASDGTRAGEASGWAESFVPAFTSGATWQFLVDGVAPGQAVRLNWSSLAPVPASLTLTLVDETSGQRVAMANSNPAWGYVFTSGASARRFRIEARTVQPAIRQLSVAPWLYSGFAMVTADLASGGTATVEILNANGQQVRLLAGSVPVGAGRHNWLWTGRDAWGRPMQAGRYTARLVLVDGRGVRHQQDRSFQF